jgi:ATP-binding protein involved in chromosome partitioning
MEGNAALPEAVRKAWQDHIERYSGLPILDLCQEQGQRLMVQLPFPAASYAPALRQELVAALGSEGNAWQVEVTWRIPATTPRAGLTALPGISNVVAIASGKGGVGKSTVAVNLAAALRHEGARVGLLDADIYGPSQGRLLGFSGRATSSDGRHLDPVVRHGIASMSIGYLVTQDTAMIWRGPMVTQALQQMLHETAWGTLDYLLIDLPPGTGDIQLTLAQRTPLSGALGITTPQELALDDARRAMAMFSQVAVPLLGIVENMAFHVCPRCGLEEDLFGHGGGARLAQELGIPLLGQLPLVKEVQEFSEQGLPIVLAQPQGSMAAAYLEVARRMAGLLATGPLQSSPQIIISDD